MAIEKLPEYYYFFFTSNNSSITHKLMRTKSHIKFYILFLYLIIVKLPLDYEERLTSALVTGSYGMEIIGCVNYRSPEIYLTFKNVENPNGNCVPTQVSA